MATIGWTDAARRAWVRLATSQAITAAADVGQGLRVAQADAQVVALETNDGERDEEPKTTPGMFCPADLLVVDKVSKPSEN